MTIEEKINLHLCWLLEQIEKECQLLGDNLTNPFNFSTGRAEALGDPSIPSISERNKLMIRLQNTEKVIEVIGQPEYIEDRGTVYSIRILQPKFDEIYKKYSDKASEIKLAQKEEKDTKNSVSRMTFDSQNGVIRYGNIKPYSFHRGIKGDRPLLNLFRKLWDERQHFLNGKNHKRGESFPINALAAQVDVTKEKLISMLKGIGRMLKTRKFPAKIERKNGILLVVTEK